MILCWYLLYICSISTSFLEASPFIIKLSLRDWLNMLKYVHKIILRAVDGALYGFIGPFSVLFIIPRFLMNISNTKSLAGFGVVGVKIAGFIIIWLGATLAVWCTILMFLFGKGTPLVTSAPQKYWIVIFMHTFVIPWCGHWYLSFLVRRWCMVSLSWLRGL